MRLKNRFLIVVLALLGIGVLTANSHGQSSQEQDSEPPSWQWSWERIEQVVNQVTAGRDLTPESWPGGNRVAVALSFDIDNETMFLSGGQTSPALMAEGAYGSRAGLPRILDLLDSYEIPASFFVPAVSARLNAETVRRIADAGHEIGLHGWIHEASSELSEAEERELMGRAIRTLEELISKKIVGVRTPSWDYSSYTPKLIAEYGMFYDSSLMMDDRPHQVLHQGDPVPFVELPVTWILDDWPYFSQSGAGSLRTFITPDEVLEIWKLEFDRAYQEGTLFLLTNHPHIIGRRSRIGVLEDLVRYMRSFSGVWFATHEDIARAAAEQMP